MPKGLGIMEAPMTAPPWRTPCTKAWRSMARLTARRTGGLPTRGRLWLRTTLSPPAAPPLHEGVAIHGEAHGPAHGRLVEGRPLVVDDHVVASVLSHFLDHEGRRGLLHRVRHGLGHLQRNEGVNAAGLKGGEPGAALADDRVADAVEIGPTVHDRARG